MASDAVVGRALDGPAAESLSLRTLVHDLRQPVLTIGLLLDLLSDRDDLGVDVREHVRQLNLERRWMEELLSSGQPRDAVVVLDSPTASEASAALYPGRADASAVAAAVIKLVSPSFHGVLRLVAAAPAVVAADHTSLRRALANLVDNAIRAAGPEGRVQVSVDVTGEGTVRIVVDDDGPGFGRVQLGKRLGLTVVAQAVVSGGGTLEIGASHLGGVSVAMNLPQADREGRP